MPTDLSAWLARHSDGWKAHICFYADRTSPACYSWCNAKNQAVSKTLLSQPDRLRWWRHLQYQWGWGHEPMLQVLTLHVDKLLTDQE
jgi:hypothetical protein